MMHPNNTVPRCDAIRYAEDKQKAKEQYEAIKQLLDAQCQSNRQRNAEEAAQHQVEIDRLKATCAADDEVARQAEVAARARQQQLNVEVTEFNRYSYQERSRVHCVTRNMNPGLVFDNMHHFG